MSDYSEDYNSLDMPSSLLAPSYVKQMFEGSCSSSLYVMSTDPSALPDALQAAVVYIGAHQEDYFMMPRVCKQAEHLTGADGGAGGNAT